MNKTTILNDKEARYVVEKALKSFGFEMAGQMKNTGVNFEDVIRLGSLGAKCEEVRALRGLSIKDIAKELGVPQYRLKAIEEPNETMILPEVLEKYIAFLELESWFKKWEDANLTLAKKLRGLEQ